MALYIRPILPANEDEWKILTKKIAEGLKNTTKLVPTPKLEEARKLIKKEYMDRIREDSDCINSDDKFVNFLYILMRDHLPAGVVEKIVMDTTNNYCSYTNVWLAKYAMNIKKRLNEK